MQTLVLSIGLTLVYSRHFLLSHLNDNTKSKTMKTLDVNKITIVTKFLETIEYNKTANLKSRLVNDYTLLM